jgi:hypothetical protein
MRVFLAAAVIMSLLTTSAFAQKAVPQYGDTDKDKTPSEIAAEKEAEQAYKRSLGNIPEQGSTDPWGAVRNTDAPKTAVTKTKSKPGTIHN